MPGWKLRKAPKNKWGDDKYWVVDETGKHYSKDPIPKERAEDQRKALYASYSSGEMKEGKGYSPLAKKVLKTQAEKRKAEEQAEAAARAAAEAAAKAAAAIPAKPVFGGPGSAFRRTGKGKASPLAKAVTVANAYNEKALQQLDAAGEAHAQGDFPSARSMMGRADANLTQAERLRGQLEAIADQEGGPRRPKKIRMPSKLAPAVPSGSPLAAARLLRTPRGKEVSARLGKGRKGKKAAVMEGEGFFGDLVGKVKEFGKRVVSVATKGVRKGYSPATRKMLQQYNGAQIVEMVVRRDPIETAIDTALNVITVGGFSAAKKSLNYDKLFHLGIVVKVKQAGRSQLLVIEKNEVINIAPAKKPTDQTEFVFVPLQGKQLTLGQLMDTAQAAKGDETFFTYDPFYNNCQDFVIGVLKANGLATEAITTFVKQPLERLIPKLPSYTSKFAKAVTDLGGVANVILEGEGLHALMTGAGLGHMMTGGRMSIEEHRARIKKAMSATPEERAAAETRRLQLAAEWDATRSIDPETGMFARKPRYDPESASEKIFRPLVTGLTKVADFAAKEIAPRIGVPKIVTEAYKTFAPPTSEFYGGGLADLLEGAGIFDDFVRGLKEGFAPAAQTYKTMKALAPLYKLAAKGALRAFTGSGYHKMEGAGVINDFIRGLKEGFAPAAQTYKTMKALAPLYKMAAKGALRAFTGRGKMEPEELEGAGIFSDFVRGLKEGFAPAVQTYKTMKALAPLYKLAAKGAVQAFTGRGSDVVTMDRKAYIAEHNRLINLLEKAGKEGAKQKAELAKEMQGGRLTGCGKYKQMVQRLADKYADIPAVSEALTGVLAKIEEIERERRTDISKATLLSIMTAALTALAPFSATGTLIPATMTGTMAAVSIGKALAAKKDKHRAILDIEKFIYRNLMDRKAAARERADSDEGLGEPVESMLPPSVAHPPPPPPTAAMRAIYPEESRVSYEPTQVSRRGRGIDVEFISLGPSKQKGKKMTVRLRIGGRPKTIHFGAAGMDDFTKTKDMAQRNRYLERHEDREDWTASGIATPGFWSRWILWGPYTSIEKNLKDVRKCFGF